MGGGGVRGADGARASWGGTLAMVAPCESPQQAAGGLETHERQKDRAARPPCQSRAAAGPRPPGWRPASRTAARGATPQSRRQPGAAPGPALGGDPPGCWRRPGEERGGREGHREAGRVGGGQREAGPATRCKASRHGRRRRSLTAAPSAGLVELQHPPTEQAACKPAAATSTHLQALEVVRAEPAAVRLAHHHALRRHTSSGNSARYRG